MPEGWWEDAEGNVTGTFPELFFFFSFSLLPCFTEWVVGREERDSLCKSRTAAHHLNSAILYVSLTRPRTPFMKAAHSVSKFSWGRSVFIFVRGAYRSFKLFKRDSFWTGLPLRVHLFNWILHWLKPRAVPILFVEQEALTSLRLLDFYGCLCLPEALLLLSPLEMRSSFMQVKPVATQQCSVSVYKLMFVFVHVSAHGVLLVFAFFVLDMGWIMKLQPKGLPSVHWVHFSSKHHLSQMGSLVFPQHWESLLTS